MPGKVRKIYRVAGLAPERYYGVHNNNVENLFRALSERVFNVVKDGVLQPPRAPREGAFDVGMKEFERGFYPSVRSTAKLTAEQFVEEYKGRKHTIYAQAAKSLETDPVGVRDAELGSFVKAEKILLKKCTAFEMLEDPCPRVIQPRDPRFNVEVGRYLKPLEKKIFGILRGMSQTNIPMVMKGFNALDTGRIMKRKWDRFNQPVAIGLDANRFDQHISADALKWEHKMYRAFYKHDKYFKWLLSMQIDNVGRAKMPDGYIKYAKTGSRMSGDMNTSLGNCLIMCACIYQFVNQAGIEKWELANNGDDCVLIVEADEYYKVAELEQHMNLYGFDVTLEPPVYVLENVEFCQTRPVWTPEGYVMVRNVIAALSKDNLSFLDLRSETATRKYFKAVGDGGSCICRGIPVMQEFYHALTRNGLDGGMKMSVGWDTGFYRMGAGMDAEYRAIHPGTRASFFLAFGVTPGEQVAKEIEYSRWTYTHSIRSVDSDCVAPPCHGGYDTSITWPHPCWESQGTTALVL